MNILAKNYEIKKELGRGGTGSVYLAHDKKLDRDVAVKVLELDSNLDKDLIDEMEKRFEKEAKAIAKLNHPNIVDIYDFGQEDGKHFMVIELLRGESLATQINKIKSLPIEKILDIGLQLCSAVSYAHKQGIIHRDIKPANVMLLDDNKVKLTDFGIAQLNNDKLNLTQVGSILGSILYIPPEQLVDSHKIDKRADVYSLGITLFQLFTGRLPFEGNSVAEVVTKILNQEIPTMSSFKNDIPEALDRIILKAIKKEPDQRYQNIDDLSSALKDIKDYLRYNINFDSNMSKKIKSETSKPINTKSNNKPQVSKSKNKFIIPVVLLFIVLGTGIYFFNLDKKVDSKIKYNTPVIKITPKPITIIKPANKISKPVIVKPNLSHKVNTTHNKILRPITHYVKPNIVRPVITRKTSIPKPIIRKQQVITKPVVQNKKSVGEGY